MSELRFVFCFCVFLFLWQPSFSQSKIDSLLRLVNYGQDDTNKVNAYGALSDGYDKISVYKSIFYGIEGLRLSVNLHYLKGMADCLNKIGAGYIDIGYYPKAINYIQKSLRLREFLKDKDAMADCYNNLGLIYYYKGEFNKAIKYYFDALKFYDFVKSTLKVQNCYYNIGNVYSLAGNYALALKYINKTLKYSIDTRNKELASVCLLGLGNVYMLQHNDSLAMKCYNEAFKYREGNSSNEALAYCHLGDIYTRQRKYSLAIMAFQKLLDIEKQHSDNRAICVTGVVLADLYNKTGDYNSAIEILLQSLSIAKRMSSVENEMLSTGVLSESYAKTGNYQRAYEYYKKFKDLNDSIYNIKSNGQIKEMAEKYESEKKEKEILIQRNRIELLEQKEIISDYKQFGFAAIILIVALGSIISVRNQKRKILLSRKMFEAQKKLKEAELNNERMKSEQLQTEKLLSEAELSNERLKSEQLQNDLDFQTKENIYKTKELEYKNKEIVNFALHIVEKNEFINKMRLTIEMYKDSLNPEKLLSVIEYDIMSLEKERKEFESKIENISHSFTMRLEEKNSDITRNEKRLASLLRLNLTSKEISMILDISMQSVDTYRCRLRKKLNLAKDESLTEYLSNI